MNTVVQCVPNSLTYSHKEASLTKNNLMGPECSDLYSLPWYCRNLRYMNINIRIDVICVHDVIDKNTEK